MNEPSSSASRPWLRSRWLVVWPAALAIMIFVGSTRSEVASPEGVPHVDKVGHFHIYGLLATLVLRVVFDPSRRWRGGLMAVLCASLYGITDEFHQSFTPGRGVEFSDWIADTLGAILAVSLYCAWPLWRRALEFPVWPRRGVRSNIAPDVAPVDGSASAR